MPTLRTTIRLTGLAALRSVLRSLPRELQQHVTAAAVARAAVPLVAAAKRLAPVRSGALRESLAAAVRKTPGGAYAVVGPARGHYRAGQRLRSGASRQGAVRPADYAHHVEFGHHIAAPRHAAVRRRGPAQQLTFVPAKPFLRPALAVSAAEVAAELEAELSAGLSQVLDRLTTAPSPRN